MAHPSKASTEPPVVAGPAQPAAVGDACSFTQPCHEGLACLSAYSDGEGAYPDGLCTTICPKDSCPTHGGNVAYCVQWPHESEAMCLADCSTHRRCDREGYTCARIQRSDSSRMRHVCVPDVKSAHAAYQKLEVDGTPILPQGTVTLDDARTAWKGSPISFATANSFLPTPAADDRDEERPSVRENDAHTARTDAPHSEKKPPRASDLGENDPTDAEREAGGGAQSAMSPPSKAEDTRAGENPEDPSQETAHEGTENSPRTDASQDLNWVSISIIGVVGLITLLTLVRMIFSGRFGGLMRSVRDAAGEETPLERIRRMERKKRVHGPRPEQPPDVRLERRRSPIRPLRSIPTSFDEEHDDVPVLSREEAVAREIIVDTPIALNDVEDGENMEDAAAETPAPSTAEAQRSTPKPTRPEEPAVPPAFTPEDLRTFSTLQRPKHLGAAADDAPAPTLVGAHPSQPANDAPPVQLWARANAARTFRANRVAPSVDEQKRIKDMDEFVAPLPIDIVLQLLDALLDYAESVRQRKGYDAIVYIETDPRKTVFQRGPEGEIRLQHAPDALAKPILAVDAMRRKGFSPHLKVPDAHLLSLVHLGRYLLGSADADDVITDIDALSSASGRFSDEELRLMRYLLAPEEHAHLQHLAMSRGRSGSLPPSPDAGVLSAGHAAPSPTTIDWLPCPECASEVHVGDLACGQCGTALHPRPVFCSSCGALNLLFADGRAQGCANISCDQEILIAPSGADAEHRRLSIVAELLSSFEEFRKLPAPGNVEHYEAFTHGRRVEIWQLPQDRGAILLEDDRPHHGLSDVFTLPHRCVEKSGVRFVIYDPPSAHKNPLHQLGPSKLAEGLLLLWDEVHRANLRGPTLAIEDLSVSDAGDVLLLHGHVLRSATAATPRIRDTRFMAPELARQAIATERSDLYTLAAIWKFALSGQLPTQDGETLSDDAFIGASDLLLELMAQCLREDAADRPTSVRYVLSQLRQRRRLSDLV